MSEAQGQGNQLVVWAYFKDLKWWPAVVVSSLRLDRPPRLRGLCISASEVSRDVYVVFICLNQREGIEITDPRFRGVLQQILQEEQQTDDQRCRVCPEDHIRRVRLRW